MEGLYTTYIILVGGAILFFIISNNRNYINRHNLRKEYTSKLISICFSDNYTSEQFPHARRAQHRDILSQTIHNILSHTYGCDSKALQQTIMCSHLNEHLLKRLFSATTFNKYITLSQLTSTINATTDTSALQELLHSHDHNLRIGALMALLAAKPSGSMQILSSIDFNLQPIDIQRIIALIRRGKISVVLEPLFENNNRNLKLLGMALVRSFGICIVDKHLYQIINEDKDPILIFDAIYTLTHLKRPLKHTLIKGGIATMSEQQRKRLCRHLSVEGYSIQSINAILSPPESLYAKRLITSYKRLLQPSYNDRHAFH